MRQVAVFDIDHTISDADWRDQFIKPPMSSNDWDEYHLRAPLDKPYKRMLHMIDSLSMNDFDIWLITSRPEKFRKITENWLKEHQFFYTKLLMRPNENIEVCSTMKVNLAFEEAAKDYVEICFIFDDKESVIREFEKQFNCYGFVCGSNNL